MASFASRVLDPPLEDNQTKEVGLQLLEILVDTVEDLLSPSSGISAADLEAILKGPLSELKSTAETLGSMSLYSDWAPPKEVHEVRECAAPEWRCTAAQRAFLCSTHIVVHSNCLLHGCHVFPLCPDANPLLAFAAFCGVVIPLYMLWKHGFIISAARCVH